jgi:transcriptional regulator with XRE-family HTH domain
MEKSIYSEEYQLFLRRLREARRAAGLTQIDLAERLGARATQSFVSKCERGERRMDVAEVRAFCRAIGVSFATFTAAVDDELNRNNADNKSEP